MRAGVPLLQGRAPEGVRARPTPLHQKHASVWQRVQQRVNGSAGGLWGGGGGRGGEALLLPHALPQPCSPAALSHRVQAVDSGCGVEARRAAQAAVHHRHHAVQRQRRLSDGRGQDDAPRRAVPAGTPTTITTIIIAASLQRRRSVAAHAWAAYKCSPSHIL